MGLVAHCGGKGKQDPFGFAQGRLALTGLSAQLGMTKSGEGGTTKQGREHASERCA